MALCRFSDYQCDLYIYESDYGIECYVATNRREAEPKPPAFSDDDGWGARYQEYWKQVEATRLYRIGLPHDGEFKTFGDLDALLEYVMKLKTIGYHVPDWVAESIREEQSAATE